MTPLLLGVPLLALAVMQPVVPRPERYGLVLVEGRDTVALERVTREHRTLRAEVLVPNRARLLVTAQTDSLGCVRDADVQVFPWGSASNATAVQRVNVRLTGDSVRVDASARGVSQSLSRPAPGVRYVMAEESIAASSLVVECAGHLRASGADSVAVTTLAFPNLRMRPMRVYWRGDSVMLASTDTSWVRLDASGTATRLVLGRGRLVVHRVSATDIDALAGAQRVASDYSAPSGAPYRAIDVQVRVSPEVVLAGTLTVPSGTTGRMPAVVTVSGSGGQDRDSYAPIADGWRPFRQLADTLARRGIATLRLDDRGIGGSTGDYATSTERTTAADIQAALAYLRARPEIDGRRLVVLGHSEGARVAMLVAAQDSALAGIALLSGAADTRAATRAQALWLAEHSSTGGVSRDTVLAIVNRQMDSLAATLPREVFRWNAAELAKDIRVPVGVFHGRTDRQVPVDQADSLVVVFRRAGNRDVTVHTFADRNHLLVRDSDGDFRRYSRLPSARLEPDVLGPITDWLVSRLSSRPRDAR